MHIKEFDLRLWRHNCPLRKKDLNLLDPVSQGDVSEVLLMLFRLHIKQVELGVEAFEGNVFGEKNYSISVEEHERRIIAKITVDGLGFYVCDYDSICIAEKRTVSSADKEKEIKRPKRTTVMDKTVEFFSLGKTQDCKEHLGNRRPDGITAIRLEYQGYPSRLSCAIEIGAGGKVKLKMDCFEKFVLLVVEALLMPAGPCCWNFNDNDKRDEYFEELATFPIGSIGHFFGLLLQKVFPTSKPGIINNATPASVEGTVPKFSLSALGIQRMLFCLYLRGFNVIIPASDPEPLCYKGSMSEFRFELCTSSLVSGFFGSSSDNLKGQMISTLAGSGRDWASYFRDEEQGHHHIVSSQQQLWHTTGEGQKDSADVPVDLLIPSFKVDCYYHPNAVEASVSNSTMAFNEMVAWRQFYDSLAHTARHSSELTRKIPLLLLSMKRVDSSFHDSCIDEELSPFYGVCKEATNSIRVAISFLGDTKRTLASHKRNLCSELSKKQKELDQMSTQVFLKEKQRVSALALIVSNACGWIRMGGNNQSRQRLITTTTLWKYWAVLRKSLLIVTSSPGSSIPLDIVSLQNAQLLSLSGTNKAADLQKGFAIVDSIGQERMFVCQTNEDYEMWVSELSRIIKVFSGSNKDEEERWDHAGESGVISADDNRVLETSEGASQINESDNVSKLPNHVSGTNKGAMTIIQTEDVEDDGNENGSFNSIEVGSEINEELLPVTESNPQACLHKFDVEEVPLEESASSSQLDPRETKNGDKPENMKLNLEQTTATQKGQEIKHRFSALGGAAKSRLGDTKSMFGSAMRVKKSVLAGHPDESYGTPHRPGLPSSKGASQINESDNVSKLPNHISGTNKGAMTIIQTEDVEDDGNENGSFNSIEVGSEINEELLPVTESNPQACLHKFDVEEVPLEESASSSQLDPRETKNGDKPENMKLNLEQTTATQKGQEIKHRFSALGGAAKSRLGDTKSMFGSAMRVKKSVLAGHPDESYGTPHRPGLPSSIRFKEKMSAIKITAKDSASSISKLGNVARVIDQKSIDLRMQKTNKGQKNYDSTDTSMPKESDSALQRVTHADSETHNESLLNQGSLTQIGVTQIDIDEIIDDGQQRTQRLRAGMSRIGSAVKSVKLDGQSMRKLNPLLADSAPSKTYTDRKDEALEDDLETRAQGIRAGMSKIGSAVKAVKLDRQSIKNFNIEATEGQNFQADNETISQELFQDEVVDDVVDKNATELPGSLIPKNENETFALVDDDVAGDVSQRGRRIRAGMTIIKSAVNSVKLDTQALKDLNSGSFQNPSRVDSDEDGPKQLSVERPSSSFSNLSLSSTSLGKKLGSRILKSGENSLSESQQKSGLKIKSLTSGPGKAILKKDVVLKHEELVTILGTWVVKVVLEEASDNEQVHSLSYPSDEIQSAKANSKVTFQATVSNVVSTERYCQQFLISSCRVDEIESTNVNVRKSLADILSFHASISGAVCQLELADQLLSSSVCKKSEDKISLFEHVRCAARKLEGILKVPKKMQRLEAFKEYQCESMKVR